MIRCFLPSDVDELKRIHSLHFANEFNVPDFTKYLFAFVAEDDQGIITFAGIRDIAECVTVTNKDRKPMERARALCEVLRTSIFICNNLGYDQIYAFSQNPKWADRLQRTAGFRPPRGQALILDL